jgi:hypothetical protein
MSRKEIYDAVLDFMGMGTTVSGVAATLKRMQAVIIKLNVGDRLGYASHGGPYIVIWKADDDTPMVWQSNDCYLENTAYRCSQDDDYQIGLKEGVHIHAYDRFTVYLIDIDDQARFKNHIREKLDLDCDWMRDSRTDREIAHAEINRLLVDSALLVAEPAQPETTTQVSQTGEEKMTKINAIVSRAKTATFSAATLQAGKALNIAVIKAAKAKAPMMVRGYLDHPAAPALMALALVSLSEFLPENPTKAKIVKAADLMLVSAMVDGADKFLNVEAMIDQVFNGLPAEVKTALES